MSPCRPDVPDHAAVRLSVHASQTLATLVHDASAILLSCLAPGAFATQNHRRRFCSGHHFTEEKNRSIVRGQRSLEISACTAALCGQKTHGGERRSRVPQALGRSCGTASSSTERRCMHLSQALSASKWICRATRGAGVDRRGRRARRQGCARVSAAAARGGCMTGTRGFVRASSNLEGADWILAAFWHLWAGAAGFDDGHGLTGQSVSGRRLVESGRDCSALLSVLPFCAWRVARVVDAWQGRLHTTMRGLICSGCFFGSRKPGVDRRVPETATNFLTSTRCLDPLPDVDTIG